MTKHPLCCRGVFYLKQKIIHDTSAARQACFNQSLCHYLKSSTLINYLDHSRCKHAMPGVDA